MIPARFPVLTTILVAWAFALALPVAGQDSGPGLGKGGKVTVRFLAESLMQGVNEVALSPDGKVVGPSFTLPRTYLSEPQETTARAFTLHAAAAGAPPAEGQATPAPPAGRKLAAIGLPAEGNAFIVLLLPAGDGQYRPLVLRADDAGFQPGDVYLYNRTTATILGRLGRNQFTIEPGAGRIERPRVDRDAPFIEVAFGHKVGDKARLLSTTRWPIDNRTRGYVFFFVDPKTQRLTYRAVDEFVPAPAARPGVGAGS